MSQYSGDIEPGPPPIELIRTTSEHLGDITTSAFDAYRVLSRVAWSGAPPGFDARYFRGWAELPLRLAPPQALPRLWLRLHDALSPGAFATQAGTGAVLQAPVQVSGALPAGPSDVRIPIPAAAAWFLADLSADAGMADALRVPIPFGAGGVDVIFGDASALAAILGDGVTPLEQVAPVSPYGAIFAPRLTSDPALFPLAWQLPGNPGASPYRSPFAAEYLSRMVTQTGINRGLLAYAAAGSSTADWRQEGSTAERPFGRLLEMLGHADMRFETALGFLGGGDAAAGLSGAETEANMLAIADALCGAASGNLVWGVGARWGGGTAPAAFAACAGLAAARAATAQPVGWDYGPDGTPGDLVRQARAYARAALGLLGADRGGYRLRRGPRVASAARDGSVIRITLAHDGATGLRGTTWARATGATPREAPAAALAQLVTVAPPGGAPLAATTLTITGPETVELQLTRDPGAAPLELSVGAGDLGALAATLGQGALCALTDDSSDGDGLPDGRDLQPTTRPVTVA